MILPSFGAQIQNLCCLCTSLNSKTFPGGVFLHKLLLARVPISHLWVACDKTRQLCHLLPQARITHSHRNVEQKLVWVKGTPPSTIKNISRMCTCICANVLATYSNCTPGRFKYLHDSRIDRIKKTQKTTACIRVR